MIRVVCYHSFEELAGGELFKYKCDHDLGHSGPHDSNPGSDHEGALWNTGDYGDRVPEFTVKDSGKREEYENGFVRDTEDGKVDLTSYIVIEDLDLVDLEGLQRYAAHMTKGAVKYGRENWRQATGLIAHLRFARSLVRHVVQLLKGDRTEDHASAIKFNVDAFEQTRKTLSSDELKERYGSIE